MKSKKCILGTKVKKAIGAASAGIMTFMMTVPVMAFSEYQGADANSIMEGTKKFFGNVGTYGGGLYAIIAIFTLGLAVRNEDNEGRNKAVLNLLAAIVLLSMGLVINLFFK